MPVSTALLRWRYPKVASSIIAWYPVRSTASTEWFNIRHSWYPDKNHEFHWLHVYMGWQENVTLIRCVWCLGYESLKRVHNYNIMHNVYLLEGGGWFWGIPPSPRHVCNNGIHLSNADSTGNMRWKWMLPSVASAVPCSVAMHYCCQLFWCMLLQWWPAMWQHLQCLAVANGNTENHSCMLTFELHGHFLC